MKTEQSISYRIQGFMCEKLGLSGCELLIFAIIYSFTKGERGSYYGTLDYLARAGGMSESTVRRSLLSLLEKNYIARCHCGKRQAYKTTPEADMGESGIEPSESAEKSTLPPISDVKEFSLPISPRYTRLKFGAHKSIGLTMEQYKSLLTLVNHETIHFYATKLENLILEKNYRTFNPYRTIKRWILDDNSL